MTVRYTNGHKQRMSMIGMSATQLSMFGRITGYMPHGDPIVRWSNGRSTIESMKNLRRD